MTSPPFRLRLRLPSSKQETLSLSSPVTIRTLLDGIQPFLQVDITQIGLKVGYPPKPLDLGAADTWGRDVNDIGIKSGETLVVTIEETVEEPVIPAQPAVSAKRQLTPTKSASPSKRGRGSVEEEPPEIPVEGGSVILRVMEDDNSCMFNALIYCIGKGLYEAKDLRQRDSLKILIVVVATKIREDSVRFDAATLGRTLDEYCAWITRPNRYFPIVLT
jgi:ubiquitin thioesterase OTU1